MDRNKAYYQAQVAHKREKVLKMDSNSKAFKERHQEEKIDFRNQDHDIKIIVEKVIDYHHTGSEVHP